MQWTCTHNLALNRIGAYRDDPKLCIRCTCATKFQAMASEYEEAHLQHLMDAVIEHLMTVSRLLTRPSAEALLVKLLKDNGLGHMVRLLAPIGFDLTPLMKRQIDRIWDLVAKALSLTSSAELSGVQMRS